MFAGGISASATSRGLFGAVLPPPSPHPLGEGKGEGERPRIVAIGRNIPSEFPDVSRKLRSARHSEFLS